MQTVHTNEDNLENHVAGPPSEPQSELPTHDESDEGFVLNLTSNGQESGEISETTSHASVNHGGSESEARDERHDYPVDIRGGSDTEEHDAMEEYANADQALDTVSSEPQLEAEPRPSGRALTLAHLNDEDLRAQIRYFCIGQDPRTIDFMAIAVRCLVCSGEGHMASSCPKLTCTNCGAFNDHFPPFCPVSQRCPRCHERGHNQAECKSRLRVPASQGTCDLCSTTGHNADDCELLWRSGPLAVVNVTDSRLKRLSCYECGQPHHLGNDCPSRRPGKPLGTSTWSMYVRSHIPDHISIRSSGEMSIKGRAQQSKPISIESDSEDERNNFVRPKVPAPKTGQIRIQTPSRPPPTSSAVNEPRRDPSRYTHKQAYADVRPYRQRGVSPRRRVFDPNGRADTYQPPLPREPIPSGGNGSSHYSGGGERYRPMPSAGANAWRQHRI